MSAPTGLPRAYGPRNDIKWLLLITFTIIFTRATTLFIPLIDDEETFALIGRILLHGGTPYVTVADNKPPLLYYWYSLWMGIFGDGNTTALHLIGMIWVALTCYFIFKIGERATSTRTGYFAALCYAVFTTTFIPAYVALHAALLLALPLTISFWALIRWHDTNRPRWMILSGVCCSIAIFFKFQALVMLPFTFWAIGYLYFRKLNRMFHSLVAGIIGYVMGAATVIVAVLGFLHYHHILQEFYDVTWKASMTYMQDGETAGHFWGRFVGHVGGYIAATFPLWIALGVQLQRRTVHYLSGDAIKRPIPTWIWGWFVATIPAVLAGGRYYCHYFIQLLPPLCLIAGVTFDRWWDCGKTYRRFITLSLAILAIGWMVPRIWFQGFADRFHIQNLRVELKIGDYLKQHMPADSTLFVWGIDPSIYFFANHTPATRFLWSDALVGRLPGIPETQQGSTNTSIYVNKESWDQFLDDFKSHPPLYIVDCASGDLRDYGKFPIQNYPTFNSIVQTQYHPETTIDGVILYRQR